MTSLALKRRIDGLERSAHQPVVRPVAKPWQILCGLVVSGFLLASPGGLLPLWGYHLHPDFRTAGNFFLVLGAGVVCGGALALRLARTVPLGRLLALAYLVAAISLVLLSAAAPPAQISYQMLALLVAGGAAGIMNTAVFEAVTSCYQSGPAGITLTGGIFFGAGCVLSAIVLARSFEEESGARWLLIVAAQVAVLAAILVHRLNVEQREAPEITLAQSMHDLRSPVAIFFALLLFLQFANEWSLAGWLPVFLIDRMGLSPETAVTLLALYWVALTAGRFAVSRLLRVIRHGRLMAISAFCALFGCTLLLAAGSRFGVISGLLLTGAGFSAIYPLVAERIASRFPYYHPGYFNGIFTFALMGGILAPFLLGHLAAGSGLRVIPLAAMLGSCAVFMLVMLIWLGHKVSGR